MPTGTNNMTEVNEVTVETPWIVNLQYVVLGLIMLGQSLSAVSVFWGQMAYLGCNVVALYRVFALGRPLADKVKDVACLGLTLAILIVKFA